MPAHPKILEFRVKKKIASKVTNSWGASQNPEGHHNPMSGSKVTAILLKQWILPIGELHREGSAPAACAAGLFSLIKC